MSYPTFDYTTISDVILHIRYAARQGVDPTRVKTALDDVFQQISDVILHIRYTARQGVDPTRVKTALDDVFQQANQSNLALLFSLRHDFPTEWSAFVNGTGDFTATILKDYFPYFTQGKGKTITIVGLDLYGEDVTKHHAVGDPVAATNGLSEQARFTLTAGPDSAGPTQVLTRTAPQVFLIIQYSL